MRACLKGLVLCIRACPAESCTLYRRWRTELIDSSREAISKVYCNRSQKLKNTSRTVVQTPCSKKNADEYQFKPAFAQRPGLVHEQLSTQRETQQWKRVAVRNGIGHTSSRALSLNKYCTKSQILDDFRFQAWCGFSVICCAKRQITKVDVYRLAIIWLPSK